MSKKRNDRKDTRRAEAKLRQQARNELTPTQQLSKLDRSGHTATKERARLTPAES